MKKGGFVLNSLSAIRKYLGFIFLIFILLSSSISLKAKDKNGEWIEDTNIYEIFVRKFTPEHNLKGVEAHLQDLSDMGVKTIWLMPTFKSPSPHCYDVTDYKSVNSDYGTLEDMKSLVAKAHSINMKVILDLPINHCGSSNPIFSSPDSKIRKDSWFIWSTKDEEWPSPWVYWDGKTLYPNNTWYKDPNTFNRGYYYAAFDKAMPDLNYNNSKSRDEIIEYFVNDVMKFWITECKVDGFRLDAARYIAENGSGKQKDQPQTHVVWQEIRAMLDKIDSKAVMVAEAPTETDAQLLSYYDDGKEFNSAFHFGFQGMLLDCIKNGQRPEGFFNELFGIQRHLPQKGTQECQDSLMLANHDSFAGARVGTQLGGDLAKEKAVAALYLLLSGNPVMYYGEEIGMQNTLGAEGDDAIRGNLDWTQYNKQKNDPNSLLSYYTKLLNLRNSYNALKEGQTYFVPASYGTTADKLTKDSDPDKSAPVMCIIRNEGTQNIMIAHNFSSKESYYIFADLTKCKIDIYEESTKGSSSLLHKVFFLKHFFHTKGGLLATELLENDSELPDITRDNMSNYPLGKFEPLSTKVLKFDRKHKKVNDSNND